MGKNSIAVLFLGVILSITLTSKSASVPWDGSTLSVLDLNHNFARQHYEVQLISFDQHIEKKMVALPGYPTTTQSHAIPADAERTSSQEFDIGLQLMDQPTLIFIGVFTAMAIGAVFGFIIEQSKQKLKLKVKRLMPPGSNNE